MTEAEWLTCADPQPMLSFLKTRSKKRKPRLFAVACCRRIWPLVVDEASRSAVLTAERFADGLATGGELRAAESAARAVWVKDVRDDAARACFHACNLGGSGLPASGAAVCAVRRHHHGRGCERANPLMTFRHTVEPDEGAAQCGLLRCVFGNPFRPAPAVDPSWLAWNGGAVAKLAAAIYDERRFADLPVLADALEDAGCADAAILAHCRGGGDHVRGCWVVDLLTGRR